MSRIVISMRHIIFVVLIGMTLASAMTSVCAQSNGTTILSETNLSGAYGSQQPFYFTITGDGHQLQLAGEIVTYGSVDVIFTEANTTDYSSIPEQYYGSNGELIIPNVSAGNYKIVVFGKTNYAGFSFTLTDIMSASITLMDLNDGTQIMQDDTAWITGDNPPLMPKLVAQVANPVQGGTMQWKLDVKYNGEVIEIPASGGFTDPLPSSQPWNIYNQYLDANGKDLGFFGGEAKLTYKLDSNSPSEIKFSIGGNNPDDNVCRAYIDSLAPGSAIAYPVAKHESFGKCGPGSLYNQFYDTNSKLKQKTNLPVRAIGFPLVSNDRGFGLYQLTNSPPPTRDQMWNWQSNVAEGVRRLTQNQGGTPFASARVLYDKLTRQHPNDPLPTVDGFSPLDATTLTAYNGFTFFVNGSKVSNKHLLWSFDAEKPAGNRWEFHPNINDYVNLVSKQVE